MRTMGNVRCLMQMPLCCIVLYFKFLLPKHRFHFPSSWYHCSGLREFCDGNATFWACQCPTAAPLARLAPLAAVNPQVLMRNSKLQSLLIWSTPHRRDPTAPIKCVQNSWRPYGAKKKNVLENTAQYSLNTKWDELLSVSQTPVGPSNTI